MCDCEKDLTNKGPQWKYEEPKNPNLVYEAEKIQRPLQTGCGARVQANERVVTEGLGEREQIGLRMVRPLDTEYSAKYRQVHCRRKFMRQEISILRVLVLGSYKVALTNIMSSLTSFSDYI